MLAGILGKGKREKGIYIVPMTSCRRDPNATS